MRLSLGSELAGLGVMLATAVGCGGATGGAATPREPVAPLATVSPVAPDPGPPPVKAKPGDMAADGPIDAGPAVIRPDEVVPAFDVTSVGGEHFSSGDIVGQEPFIVVFFATWCPVCELKMPIVERAFSQVLDPLGDAKPKVLLVSYDDEDSWDKVAGYLAHHQIEGSLIRAEENRAFARAYDPFNGFPLVLVVGRDGVIAELQMGSKPRHEAALVDVLRAVTAPASD